MGPNVLQVSVELQWVGHHWDISLGREIDDFQAVHFAKDYLALQSVILVTGYPDQWEVHI